MLLLLKKFYIPSLSLAVLLALTGCGHESTITASTGSAVSVNLIGIVDSSTGKISKPYQIALVKLSITLGADTVDVIDVIPDTATGRISAVLSLFSGNDYLISALAYDTADGSGPVRYDGSLQTGIIQPDTTQLTIHLAPAAPGSTASITHTYISNLTAFGTTLMADVTSSSNYTVVYFEWRPEGTTEYTKTPIQNLGTSETSIAITESLTGLQTGITYYFRAVTVNSERTEYGPEISFTTSPSNALLSWTPPTTNADGTPLNDLKGYRVYHRDPYGTDNVYEILVSTLPQQAATVTYTLTSLSQGIHYFSVTAFDVYNNESVHTPELSKTFL